MPDINYIIPVIAMVYVIYMILVSKRVLCDTSLLKENLRLSTENSQLLEDNDQLSEEITYLKEARIRYECEDKPDALSELCELRAANKSLRDHLQKQNAMNQIN